MEKPDVLFSEEQIRRRVAELGAEITKAYAGQPLSIVGMMKSGLVFMADLIRQIPLDLTVHMVRATQAGKGGTEITYAAEVRYEGENILLVDDIVDTGVTLSYLLEHIREHGPRSLRVCALVDKSADRKVDVRPDWAVFTLREPLAGDRFIVGYGLDHDEQYRGLPFLGTIPRPVGPAEGRKITISRPGGPEQ
jgi:hypoxanthine phosphoribosyltransferase